MSAEYLDEASWTFDLHCYEIIDLLCFNQEEEGGEGRKGGGGEKEGRAEGRGEERRGVELSMVQ
jgi:hypothetical protein